MSYSQLLQGIKSKEGAIVQDPDFVVAQYSVRKHTQKKRINIPLRIHSNTFYSDDICFRERGGSQVSSSRTQQGAEPTAYVTVTRDTTLTRQQAGWFQ